YKAEGSVLLMGTKTLTGKELEADMFSFELLDANSSVLETVQNADDGSFAFSPISYTLADAGQTYTYKVREAAGDSEHMIYDATVYTVTVTIADNGDGTLTATPVITRMGQEVSEITFNNVLEAPLTISKKVVGCETAEPFAFLVCFFHADGTEVTEPVAYTGDLTGEVLSGDLVFLTHNQSITFTGLLPGMRYTVEEYENVAFQTTVNSLPMNRVEGESVEGGNRADFVNKLKTTTFSVTKAWQGDHGGIISLTLYANGEKLDPQPAYTRDGDVYTYTDLPKYNADGDLIVYSAKERYMDGYMTIYDNVSPYDGDSKMIYDGGTIINRSVTSIRVQKIWVGMPEDVETPPITLTLYCNGEATDRKQPKPDENGWYVYKNLPKYVNGEEAEYYVLEEALDGFVPIYTDANGEMAEWAGNGYTITNVLMPATGDSSSVMLWAVVLTASSAMMLMLMRRRKAN
ncbi:MAG: Cna B-type domain-containing protein, partial [Clostridia bacterium]|nr:Cna B-type domain-containing protein [Clostridia bacterium]